jgi:hypothetical protein
MRPTFSIASSFSQPKTILLPSSRIGCAPGRRTRPPFVETCGRALTVTVFSKKDYRDVNEMIESSDHFVRSAEVQVSGLGEGTAVHDFSGEAGLLNTRNPLHDFLQAYIERERFLMSELTAARGQVDNLLEHQRVLIEMISRLSGLGATTAPAAGQLAKDHAQTACRGREGGSLCGP